MLDTVFMLYCSYLCLSFLITWFHMIRYREYPMVSIFSRTLAGISQPCVHMLLACKVRRWRLFVFSPFLISPSPSLVVISGPLDSCDKSCELNFARNLKRRPKFHCISVSSSNEDVCAPFLHFLWVFSVFAQTSIPWRFLFTEHVETKHFSGCLSFYAIKNLLSHIMICSCHRTLQYRTATSFSRQQDFKH